VSYLVVLVIGIAIGWVGNGFYSASVAPKVKAELTDLEKKL